MIDPNLIKLETEYIRLRDEWYAADDQDEDLLRNRQIDKDVYVARCKQREAEYGAKFAGMLAQAAEMQR